MKKLMFTAAIAAFGVNAFAEITSANIVGYQTYAADEFGYTLISPAFAPINAEEAKWECGETIYDKPVVGGDSVMLLEPTVFDFNAFMFLGYDGETSMGWDATVWDPDTFEPLNDVVASIELAKGQPVYFTAGGEEVPTIAGQVDDITKSQVIKFPEALTYEFSNPFPQATTIADLNTFCKGGDSIYMLDTEIFDFVTYFCLGDGTWEVSTPTWDDWVTDTITDPTTVVLGAGQGGYYGVADEDGRTWTVSVK